ncbi:hypothetical protein BH10ACI1_BH10ACI1_24540 [soil metagenome]
MKNENLTNKKGFSPNSIQSIKAALMFLSLCLLFFVSASAQDYPNEIRGYKVQKAKITVKNEGEKTDSKDDSEAFVTLSDPVVSSISLTGVTFEMTAKISPVEQGGKVDFLTFNDFKVNGLDVNIEEYTESFEFEKNKAFELPKPIKVFVGTSQALFGGLGEMRDSKEEWDVTGTVFVFGKFKKYGFNFKRVIPVPVNIKIKNPLKKVRPQSSIF